MKLGEGHPAAPEYLGGLLTKKRLAQGSLNRRQNNSHNKRSLRMEMRGKCLFSNLHLETCEAESSICK